MKHIYAVETKEELFKYQEFVHQIQPRLEEYIRFLEKGYQVMDLPRTILWTNMEIATKRINDMPVPAYTNEFRIVMTPDLEAWRSIYLKQLDGVKESDTVRNIREYYNHALSINNIMQILGHELAHHSELFLDNFDASYSSGIWFEEGMVEYISRHYFLTPEEFEAEADINRKLVAILQDRYGGHPLEEFGKSTYEGDYASIFFEYWRSFLAVEQIIEAYHGDIQAVFSAYHQWNEANSGKTLEEWFHIL